MLRLRSLRALTLVFLFAFTAATIGTGWISYTATSRTIVRLVDARIAAAADAVAARNTAPATADLLRRIKVLDDDRDTGDLGVILSDRRGHTLGGNVILAHGLPLGFSTVRVDEGIKGLSHGRAYVRRVGDGHVLTIIAETEPFDDYAATRLRIYVAGFGTILLVVFAGTILFARAVAARIATTRDTARAIIAGDMRQRVPIRGDGGVFDGQAALFNLMLDRIADLMRTMSTISGDIAHDLRTPLARLRSQLESLSRRAETPAMRNDIERALAQSDELLAMFSAVLRIAEVEGGDRRAAFALVDVAGLARDVTAMMTPVAEDAGYALAFGQAAPTMIMGDRLLLTQLQINLIENVLRHTPPGTRIAVRVDRRGGDAMLVVSDDGPGIPASEYARVLRRFGRLDESRRGDTRDGSVGHGLGLALVEAIARLHDGTVQLEDAAPGLRVAITLPVRTGM